MSSFFSFLFSVAAFFLLEASAHGKQAGKAIGKLLHVVGVPPPDPQMHSLAR